ncbi:MAG: TIGR02757 family protein [Sandaracinaceae bacterium]|nr:TIGR02757 family protein [Sandaracinaceae bacterium]
MSDTLAAHLDPLAARFDRAAHRAADPVELVHRYADPADREVAGLVAALLAFGNVRAVKRSVTRVLDVLGERPAEALARTRRATLIRRLDGFVHRVWRGEHVARLLANAGALRAREGSLGAAFGSRLARADGELREGLAAFADALRGPDPDRAMSHLVPDPRAGSACKRLLLYLRWMVRPADGVDLGLWPEVSPARLLVPVDTHVHRIGKNLRLTERASASWQTAEDITRALAALDPADPVKYDFVLCHLGISGQCPSRRDPAVCAACTLRAVCRHWR